MKARTQSLRLWLDHPQGGRVLYDDADDSRRTGSVTIDERTGRVDMYDAGSNRTGYGQVDPRTGTVELFDLKGNRLGSGTITPSGGSIREERR